jgi:hypothetical protein
MAAMITIFTVLALLTFPFVMQPLRRQAVAASGRPTSHPAK